MLTSSRNTSAAFQVFGKEEMNRKYDAERLERSLTISTLPYNLHPEELSEESRVVCHNETGNCILLTMNTLRFNNTFNTVIFNVR